MREKRRINRVAFIEPGASERNIYSMFPMPRTGPVLLATILANHGYETRVFVEDVKKIDKGDLIFINSADVVGISTTTSTAPRAYQTADYWRARGKTVIIGGVHASFMAEEALQHADYVIRKEGEAALLELLSSLNGEGPGLDEIGNLLYLKDGKVVRNPGRKLIDNLDNNPVPDFSLVAGKLKGLILPLITSRGCPFECNFCCVIKMFGRGYRFKSVNRVLQEIKELLRQKPASIFIADDNFAANIPRAKRLLHGIIKMIKCGEVKKFRWTAQVRVDAAKDEELVALMSEAGCRRVYIGFESLDNEVLKKMRKKQRKSDIVAAIRMFHSFDIQIHGMFIVGTDEERDSAADEISSFAWRHKIETIQILISSPFPGTSLYDKLDNAGRILHKQWGEYSLHHCVVKQLGGKPSPEIIRYKSNQAMLSFFSWKYVAWHAFRGPLYFLNGIKRGFFFKDALFDSFFLASLGAFANFYLRKEV